MTIEAPSAVPTGDPPQSVMDAVPFPLAHRTAPPGLSGTGSDGAQTPTDRPTGSVHGRSGNGAAPDGEASNGAAPNGAAFNGAAPESVALNGAAPDGEALNGAAPEGGAVNGAAPEDVALNGAALDGAAPDGVMPDGSARWDGEAAEDTGSGPARGEAQPDQPQSADPVPTPHDQVPPDRLPDDQDAGDHASVNGQAPAAEADGLEQEAFQFDGREFDGREDDGVVLVAYSNGEPLADEVPPHGMLADEVVAAEVADRLGSVVGEDVEADPAEFAAAAVLDVLRASGWADAAEAAELRAETERLRELLNMVVRDHRAREASAVGVENQQLHWLVPLLRSAHGVAFGTLGAKVALRTAVQDVPPEVLASAGLRIDYGVEPVYEDDQTRA